MLDKNDKGFTKLVLKKTLLRKFAIIRECLLLKSLTFVHSLANLISWDRYVPYDGLEGTSLLRQG